MQKIEFYLILIITILLLSNCSEIVNSNNNNDSYSISSIPKSVTSSQNNFAFKLLQEIHNQEPDSTVFISPISASLALTMTMNGADGETLQEMRNVLEYSTDDLKEINAACKALIDELYELDTDVEFNLANGIWFTDRYTLQSNFRELNQSYFNAKIESLDFTDVEHSMNVMNSWVEDQTKERIKNLIKESDFAGPVVMFLINAIYFKANWEYQFNKESTRKSSFYTINGDQVNCQMMSQKQEFSYYSNKNIQAIDLPYANDNYSMTILLPRKMENIDSVLKAINNEKLNDIIDNFKKDSVNVFLPKFEIEYEKSLKEILMYMGMENPFTAAANFSKIFNESKSDISISKVRQKSFLKVDEEGTEASAATVVILVERGGMDTDEEIYMRVNHPFLIFIREKRSGTILFSGKIMKPVWNE